MHLKETRHNELIVSEALRSCNVKETTITQLLALLQSDFGGIQDAKAIQRRLSNYARNIKNIRTDNERMWNEFNEFVASAFKGVFGDIEKARTFFQEKLNSSIIVDLCSRGTWEYYKYSLEIKPKKMIYVDKFNIRSIDESDKGTTYLSMDALALTSVLPDNSVQYSMSWIDDCIIDPAIGQNKEYLYALQKEIFRTLQPWGLFFWYRNLRTDILAKGMNNILKDILNENEIYSDPFLFEKK